MKEPFLIDSNNYVDDRGYFKELWKEGNKYKDIVFKQDNFSCSKKNVFRGFHFQNPYPQGKLVTVLQGSVIDIIIDIRVNSPTYKQSFSYWLSENNSDQLYVPEGFAHGFVSLENDTFFNYKCTNIYYKDGEHCLVYNDENIKWSKLGININDLIISDKDKNGKTITQLEEERILF